MRCGTCSREWSEGYVVCPDDGTRLGGSTHPTTGSLAPDLAQRSPYVEDLAPGSFAGEYRIEKKIGQGGMGAVYGAKHPVIGKRAAIKVIRRELSSNPEAVDRFVREAQAVNTIAHPNIVDVFAFGVLPDGRSFFVMEWLQGEALRQRLERPLMYAEAIEIIDTMAKALIAAHDAGVVHRDLKPDNVFLSAVKDEKPVVMLLDFGLAKLIGEDGQIEQTRTGEVMGTPLYISPEQAKGIKVERATDTYALGVMAYEMFSGRVPFLAESAVEIMSMHITETPRAPSEIAPCLPREVDALVLAMMAKDPAKRPSLRDVRKQLVALRDLSPSTTPVGGGPVPGAWARATPLPTATEMSVNPNALTRLSGQPLASGAAGSMPTLLPMRSARGRRTGLIVGVAVAAGALAFALAMSLRGSTSDDAETNLPDQRVATTTSVTVPAPAPTLSPAAVLAPAATVVPPAASAPVAPAPVALAPVTPEPPTPGPVNDLGGAQRTAKQGKVIVTIAGAPRARLFVDGRVAGTDVTKVTLSLARGRHKLRAEAPRHTAAEATVYIGVGAQRLVRLTLKKAAGGVDAVEDPFGR